MAACACKVSLLLRCVRVCTCMCVPPWGAVCVPGCANLIHASSIHVRLPAHAWMQICGCVLWWGGEFSACVLAKWFTGSGEHPQAGPRDFYHSCALAPYFPALSQNSCNYRDFLEWRGRSLVLISLNRSASHTIHTKREGVRTRSPWCQNLHPKDPRKPKHWALHWSQTAWPWFSALAATVPQCVYL